MASNARKTCLLVLFFLTQQVLAQNLPPLIDLAKQQRWEELSLLLEDGLNPNVIYGDGTTALHWASYHDNENATDALLTAGANVDSTTDLGVTPLWLAAQNGNLDLVNTLLSAGADPTIRLLSGETPVMTAAQAGNGAVVKVMLEAGADPNVSVTRDQTALMWAADRGHSDVVAALLEHGVDIEARSQVREQYVKSEKEQDSHPSYKYWIEQGGNTALMFAARSGDLRSTELLIEAGSNVNSVSAFGTSPVIMAVHGGSAELLNYLIERGANIESNESGHTALHAAVLRGNLKAVDVLIKHGANLEALLEKPTPVRRQSTDYNFHDSLLGATPLWLAARFSEPQIMKTLINAGANPLVINHMAYPAQRRGENFIRDEGEINLLMAATGMGHWRLRVSWGTPERREGQLQDRESLILDSAIVALQAGADINARDGEGQTALAFTKQRNYDSVVQMLEAAGALE
jgi:ankyrin repeat protein